MKCFAVSPLAALFLFLCAGGASSSPIKSDENVVFFPSQASLDESGAWRVPLHGFVFEPETDSVKRGAFLAALRALLEDHWTEEENRLFAERMRLFLVDAESGKSVTVDLAGRKVTLGPSDGDGHVYATAEIRAEGRRVPFRSCEGRDFSGEVELVPPVGISVVSDIDDTIKVTHVRDRKELLANTFLRKFVPVEGMAQAYRRWEAAGAVFHYLSGTPWELSGLLEEYFRTEGFPKGGLYLRKIEYTPAGARQFSAPPADLKNKTLAALLDRYPRRTFVLVGDSGERDPEVYAEIARSRPGRVARIWIRDVTGEAPDAGRYTEAFAGLPSQLWTLFKSGEELPPDPLGANP
jgi:phosphatidate phosphatase APP1